MASKKRKSNHPFSGVVMRRKLCFRVGLCHLIIVSCSVPPSANNGTGGVGAWNGSRKKPIFTRIILDELKEARSMFH
jgi:hypothetical protein